MRRLLQVSIAVMVLLMLPLAQAHERHKHAPVTMKRALDIALDASLNAQPSMGLAFKVLLLGGLLSILSFFGVSLFY